MRERVWKTISKVIARGRLRTEAEYYLVIERLMDVDDETLCPENCATLETLVSELEERRR
jgi:hypothetical protein